MTTNKTLSQRALEMWAGDATLDLSIFKPGYQNHQEPLAEGGSGTVDLEEWAEIVRSSHLSFPDLKVDILMQIGEENRVATYWRFSGTQKGEYIGKPGSDRPTSWTGVQIDRFEDGKIAESWVVWDFYTQLCDLGYVTAH